MDKHQGKCQQLQRGTNQNRFFLNLQDHLVADYRTDNKESNNAVEQKPPFCGFFIACMPVFRHCGGTAAQIADALLKLQTVQALTGMGRTSLYARIKAGELAVVRIGSRCTRVRASEAQRFLRALGKEAAA